MSISAFDTKVSMLFRLPLANIRILSCFFVLFLVMLNNFLVIPVITEKNNFPFNFPFFFPESGLTIPFPANMFPNKLAPKVLNNIRNNSICSFVSFLIVLVTPSYKILEFSRAWTIFIMSLIFSFEIIKIVVPEPWIFFSILALNAEAAAVIPRAAKIFSARGTSTFNNGHANLLNNDPKNLPD